MRGISIIDSILKGLYKLADICLENNKQRYSKENISKYGKEHGFSDEYIEQVYTNVKYNLYDAEDYLNYIKDKVDDIRDVVEAVIDNGNDEGIDEDYIEDSNENCIEDINEELRDILYNKISNMLLVAEEFSKGSLPIIIRWRCGEGGIYENLLYELENDINNYKKCYIKDEIIVETGFKLFIELNDEINRFIKVNQMLIYGIKNKQFNIVDEAINRFYNLFKNYN